MDFAKEAMETLRNARFPVYAVPPSQFDGDVMLRGTWGDRKHALAITMSYDDDLSVERPARQIEITSTGPEGMSKRAPAHSMLLFEGSYETELANFVNNISPRHLPEDEHGVCQAGRRYPLPIAELGNGRFLERVAFDEHPELRLYRSQTPEVEVLFLGWGFDDDTLIDVTKKARAIQEDEGLFKEIEAAEFQAWEKINARKHPRT